MSYIGALICSTERERVIERKRERVIERKKMNRAIE